MTARHPHAWARTVIDDFEHDPKVMFKFHLCAMVFWMANAVIALIVFIFFQHVWVAIAVLYVLMISLYSNWDTDYDAMSASLAAMKADKLLERNPEKGAP